MLAAKNEEIEEEGSDFTDDDYDDNDDDEGVKGKDDGGAFAGSHMKTDVLSEEMKVAFSVRSIAQQEYRRFCVSMSFRHKQ